MPRVAVVELCDVEHSTELVHGCDGEGPLVRIDSTNHDHDLASSSRPTYDVDLRKDNRAS